jgi:transposase
MSMHPEPIFEVPELTATVAKAAFPKGNRYMKMRDELGTLYSDEQFADLYPRVGQPASTPWRLALVTLVQFAEDLTDRQAADAIRSRIDLKYLLGLELDDAGFDFSVLSEFRKRLLDGGAEGRLLNVMLAVFVERKWLKAKGKQRTDSTHILAAVRHLNRLEIVGETLHHALNILAQVDPVQGVRSNKVAKAKLGVTSVAKALR